MEKHNDYKLKNPVDRMEKGSKMAKKGQMAIFIIVAIAIVALILLIAFYPRIRSVVTGGELTSSNFIKSCIGSDVQTNMELMNNQGGYISPEGFYVYNGKKLKFLCYTNEYYKTCVVQDPAVVSHYEKELANAIKSKAAQCYADMKTQYQKQGYSVSGILRDVKVELTDKSVNVLFDAPLSISKESTSTYNGVTIQIDSKIYNLLSIVQSIVEFEAYYGDSETTNYIQYYPDLKIEKIKQSDGTKVYKVSDVISKEEFDFASRSLSWPPGYEGVNAK